MLSLSSNRQEVHIYDLASPKAPCLRLEDSRQSSRSEGVITTTFVQPSSSAAKSSSSTHLLTGGSYGTVRLWNIMSKPNSSRQQRRGDSLSSKCLWSIPVFGSKGEGVCDTMVLPSTTLTTPATNSAPSNKKPLVLLTGNASSLALLDTNKCTRKAFSTTVTPTVAASWDLHQLASRELSRIDSTSQSILPPRRWMAINRLHLIERHGGCLKDGGVSAWYRIGMVAKCGWIFVADLSVPSGGDRIDRNQTTAQADLIRLSFRIVHHTARIQVFNSSNERLTALGGMALQFSLPEIPVPSSSSASAFHDTIWLGDVEAQRYTMPHKDKYVLGAEQHVTAVSSSQSSTDGGPGEGLILAHFNKIIEAAASRDEAQDDAESHHNACIHDRLHLPSRHGSPLSLASHPSGEWMVVGYGSNGRGEITTPLQLVSMRKRHSGL